MSKFFIFVEKLEITLFDKIFLFLYSSLLVYLIVTSASVLTFGGALLIFGAWFVFKGEIFVATWLYLIADSIWATNALEHGDNEGALFILVGMLLGLGATYKMQIGKFAKSIKK